MAGVLVTDGEQRAALAVVRSLGRAGYRVGVCSVRRRSLAGASRYAAARQVVPDPLAEPAAFVEEVRNCARRWNSRLIVPITEAALLALLPERARFGDAVIPFPEAEVFRRIADKAAVLRAATELGIATPAQHELAAPIEAGSALPAELRFPLVLKPSRSVGEAQGQRYKLSVRYAANAQQLHDELHELPAAAYPLLLQQRIVGPGTGVFLLVWQGRVVARFAHRRLREKPPSGGVSVYSESVPADAELVQTSARLLERLGWFGPAMVEYKRDAATGVPYLMEINGRFWGSLQLAVDAGVDFPLLLARLALGETVEPVTRYRAGVRERWWWGEVDHMVARLRRSNEQLALPPGSPGRWHALRQFLTLWRPGDRNEVLRLNDPIPFFRETVDWFARR